MSPFSKEPVMTCRSCFHPLVTSLQPHCLLPHGTEWHSLEEDPRYPMFYFYTLDNLLVTIHCNNRHRVARIMSHYYGTLIVDCKCTNTLLLQANTFQVVLAADQQMTFVFFIFGDIQWGVGANIDFNAGDGVRFFMVPDALTNQILNIDEESNVGVTGVYIYRVDLCSVLGPRDGKKRNILVLTARNILMGKSWWKNII